jgi:hypothetical protein
MYSIKVKKDPGVAGKGSSSRPTSPHDPGASSSAAASPTVAHTVAPPDADAGSAGALDDAVAFSAGNPRVEHITGVVHLYRHIPTPSAEAAAEAAAPGSLPDGRSPTLCLLALPPDMGFAELCAFLGAYLLKVKEARLVRRNGAGMGVCLVLLTFDSQGSTDEFYADFNNKPVRGASTFHLQPSFFCSQPFSNWLCVYVCACLTTEL